MADYREDISYEVTFEPEATPRQREDYWETGAALQATDGLEVSGYAREQAKGYISGDVDAGELAEAIERHYDGGDATGRQREADVVAARIAGLLETRSFSLRPATLFAIHSRLFKDVLPAKWVGRARTENITKREPVLGGRSVQYMDCSMIADALAYDFSQESGRAYSSPLDELQVSRFARFVAGVWQIHPFREGNTRTIAAFSQLYLRSIGVEANNEPFKEHSELFRDMLVRASFSSIELGVAENYSFITAFYENIALGKGNDFASMDLNIHGIRIDEEADYRTTPMQQASVAKARANHNVGPGRSEGLKGPRH